MLTRIRVLILQYDKSFRKLCLSKRLNCLENITHWHENVFTNTPAVDHDITYTTQITVFSILDEVS